MNAPRPLVSTSARTTRKRRKPDEGWQFAQIICGLVVFGLVTWLPYLLMLGSWAVAYCVVLFGGVLVLIIVCISLAQPFETPPIAPYASPRIMLSDLRDEMTRALTRPNAPELVTIEVKIAALRDLAVCRRDKAMLNALDTMQSVVTRAQNGDVSDAVAMLDALDAKMKALRK